MSDPSAATGRHGRVGRAWRAATRGDVDLSVPVGSLTLANPVMTASGTAGHADELEAYGPLAALGAVVVKSLSVDPWPGNPAPRVHQAGAGMLNSVGLQGPGIEAWARDDLPRLAHAGARTVVSIWGQRVADYAGAAALLAGIDGLTAVEVNVSCPNIEDRRHMFAHSPTATAEVMSAVSERLGGVPLWAKLSPTVSDLAEVAGAALGNGAEAVTLVNTALGMAIDLERRAPALGSGPAGGGLSGPSIHPIAVARRLRRAGRPPRRHHHRRRRGDDRTGRRRAPARRCGRGAGRDGDLPRPAGGVAGARRGRGVVRLPRGAGGAHAAGTGPRMTVGAGRPVAGRPGATEPGMGDWT